VVQRIGHAEQIDQPGTTRRFAGERQPALIGQDVDGR